MQEFTLFAERILDCTWVALGYFEVAQEVHPGDLPWEAGTFRLSEDDSYLTVRLHSSEN